MTLLPEGASSGGSVAGSGGTTVGILGSTWRSRVTPAGAVEVDAPGTGSLRWWVVAEDRWHDPGAEPTTRQRLVDGAPVVETRVRVPGGDLVATVYAVADGGGLTVLDFVNESSAAVAVVCSHGGLRTARAPSVIPPGGSTPSDVPPDAVAFPLGHQASVRVALAHDGSSGPLPDSVAGAVTVARGWTRHVEAASRLVLPDESLVAAVVGRRCELALRGPVDDRVDAAAALVGMAELVRLGEDAHEWAMAAVPIAERLARSARTCGLAWDASVALEGTEWLLATGGDTRGAADVAAIRGRLGTGGPAPPSLPEGILAVPWIERLLARPGVGACELVPAGWPAGWLGANWESHRLPAGPRSSVSFAVRWHGERPAVLWEVHGDPIALRAPAVAPGWHTQDPRGEVLWPEPT